MNKKQFKEHINRYGGFCHISLESASCELPSAAGLKVEAPTAEERKKYNVPEGAIYFKGIASNADLNRNGYIIVLEAWKKGIKDYMQNPQILLGHDQDKSVGRCTVMEITEQGLYVEGYAFDDYTEQRFSRGLLTAMSTGHYTVKFDFINLKTGEVLTKTDFRRRWDEFWGLDEKDQNHLDNWVRRITETEIVEFSLVSIPANRKSLISSREDLEKWRETEALAAGVAKSDEMADNLNVTTESMLMHTLTETDLEKYPTLASKHKVGEAISASAWAQITGEKTETNDPADSKPEDTTAENADETAAGDDTPADETDGEEGDAAAADEDEPAEGGDETSDPADSPADEPEAEPTDETDGGDDDGGEAEEKVKISKADREKLKAEAEAAKNRAAELAAAVENTFADGDEDEEAPAATEAATVKVDVLNMEKVKEVMQELVNTIESQQAQINTLTATLEAMPAKRGLILHNQFAASEKVAKDAKAETAQNQEKTSAQVKELEGVFAASGLAHLLKK